ALRNLPDVVVDAGQLSALGSTADAAGRPTDPRFAVAQDRLTQAADDVSTEPGANYTVDLSLLGPLDEFTAATNDLSQAADALQANSGGTDRLSGANS